MSAWVYAVFILVIDAFLIHFYLHVRHSAKRLRDECDAIERRLTGR